MTVTQLVKVSSSREKVYIDQNFAFVLYKGEIHKYGIQEGKELDAAIYKELMEEVLPKRAILRCMNLLQSKDYTTEQLKRKLRQGYYSEEMIEKAIAYVASYRYIDDERYALDYITYHAETKSRRKIINDLKLKGISDDTIMKAFSNWEELGNEQNEEALIKQLLMKKHYDKDTADQKEKQRLYGFLLRRGFSHDTICKVLLK